jgi:hypothetical protein
MRASLLSFLLALPLAAVLAEPVHAYGDGTPDESPPAEETVCEDAGLIGASYGLCIAFCEANDCDVAPDATACERLRANYAKLTGESQLPCEFEQPD